MRIFLTGATGFLGGYVAEACVEQTPAHAGAADADDDEDVGLIAEEVYELMPELVFLINGKPNSVKYEKLSTYLLQEVIRSNKKMEKLEKQVNLLTKILYG